MATMIWTDDELRLAVVWRGGTTFNVHHAEGSSAALGWALGPAAESFTRYGDDHGRAPSSAQASRWALAWLREASAAREIEIGTNLSR